MFGRVCTGKGHFCFEILERKGANMRNRFLLTFVTFCTVCCSMNLVNAALRRGYTDKEVRQVQIELLRRGYYITSTDSVFGPETEAAVKMFQRHNGLFVSGIVDMQTYWSLFGRNKRDKNCVTADNRTIKILDAAVSMLGVPYLFGGENKNGIDCSAFVQQAYQVGGVKIPRTADLQYDDKNAKKIPINEIRPGDLLFYTTYTSGASHVGIFIGNGKFIQSGSSTGVTISDAFMGYWGERYLGACRYF